MRHIRGPLIFNTHKILTTGNYTVVNESVVIVKKTVGAATQITLPASDSTNNGVRKVWVHDAKGDAATNAITVVPAGTDTINGGSSFVISENYGKAAFLDTGSGAWILATAPEVSAAEVAFLNGVTAGTVAASKAVVVDANKDVATLRNLRATRVIEAQGAETFDSTAGNLTLTAAMVIGGTLLRDPNGAGRTDVLPTAALLVAAIPGATVGDIVALYVVNCADAAETITMSAGSGGTWNVNQPAGARIIPQNTSRWVFVRLTNVTASSEAYSAWM